MLEWTNRDAFYERGRALVNQSRSVMDIGCGIRPQTIVGSPSVFVCVEAHDEYVAELRRRFAGTTTIIIQGRVPDSLKVLPDRCIDTVMMLDVIEHLDRDAGKETIQECERLARHQVVVFTPLGFMPQDETGETDGWGFHGNYWQAHRSGWTPEDFGPMWHVVACRDFHLVNGKGEELPEPFGALWAILTKDKSGFSPAETHSREEAVTVVAAGLRQREASALAKEIELRRREERVAGLERSPHPGPRRRSVCSKFVESMAGLVRRGLPRR